MTNLFKIQHEDVKKNLLSYCESHSNQLSKSHTLFRACEYILILTFRLYFPVWVKFGISDLHITLFSFAQ